MFKSGNIVSSGELNGIVGTVIDVFEAYKFCIVEDHLTGQRGSHDFATLEVVAENEEEWGRSIL
jgi:hypothetical protein